MLQLTRAATVALLAIPCSAATWIVDDDGGPGVDFTDIQPAIDAASTGDVIRVLPGVYSYFTLDRALVVVGEPGAQINWFTTGSYVSGIQAGDMAVVAGLSFAGGLEISNCDVPVVIDSVQTGTYLVASGSSDVRVRDCVAAGMGSYNGARLEIGESASLGREGYYGYPQGGQGGNALVCSAASIAHAYRSVFQGGEGGDSDPFNAGIGGTGGDGASCSAGELLLAGDAAHTVTGGSGGYPGGMPGTGLRLTNLAVARHSGVTISGISTQGGSTIMNPSPPDPALRILAPVAAGGTVTFRVHAEPGATVALNLGRFATVVDVPGPAEDQLVVVVRTFNLGTVGSSGTVGLNFTLPAYLQTGFVFFTQARVTLQGGETRYSNSVPVVVR